MKTLDIKNMTQKEFDDLIAEIKAKNSYLFKLISDFVNRKITNEELKIALREYTQN